MAGLVLRDRADVDIHVTLLQQLVRFLWWNSLHRHGVILAAER